LDPSAAAPKIRKSVAAHLSKNGLGAELISTSIAPDGARS